MTGVFSGLIKQRTMWAREVVDNAKPQCKSQDAETGYPNVTGPEDSLFPWGEHGTTVDMAEKDEYGRPTLKCASCPFSEWTRKGTKSTPPPCSERYTMPMRYAAGINEAHVTFGDLDRAGIISFQRSGITPAKNYISTFVRAKTGIFTKFVNITLRMETRGKVTYSVPIFKLVGNVPQDEWEILVKEYRTLREFLRRAPRPADDAVATEPAAPPLGQPQGNTQASPSTASTPAARVIDSVAVPTSSMVTVPDDDDLPF